jgi:urea carboxylase
VWNRFRRAGLFAEHPWSLRFFDQIEWYPVSAEELLDLRAETDAGRGHVTVTDGWFDYRSYTRFLAEHAGGIAAFRSRQAAAFAAEKERWRAAGEFDRADPEPVPSATEDTIEIPERSVALRAPFTASVWQVTARPGSHVSKGDKLVSLEAMKMETILTAPHDGTVAGIYVAAGAQVTAGQVVAAVLPDAGLPSIGGAAR